MPLIIIIMMALLQRPLAGTGRPGPGPGRRRAGTVTVKLFMFKFSASDEADDQNLNPLAAWQCFGPGGVSAGPQ